MTVSGRCSGKLQYDDVLAACIDAITATIDSGLPMKVYVCRTCHYLHLTAHVLRHPVPVGWTPPAITTVGDSNPALAELYQKLRQPPLYPAGPSPKLGLDNNRSTADRGEPLEGTS